MVCVWPRLSYGLIWPNTTLNQVVEQDCSDIHQLFWPGPKATRRCMNNGKWGNVDIRQCTVKNGSSLILFSTYLEMHDACEINKVQIQCMHVKYGYSNVFYDRLRVCSYYN